MTKFNQIRAAAAITLSLTQTIAMAQSVVITYGPADIASVPTLSQWGMIIMSVLLAGAAAMAIRKGAGSKATLSLLFAGLVSLTGGAYITGDAFALPPTPAPLNMTNATGGTLTAPQGPFSTQVVNQRPERMKILSITPAEAINSAPGGCVAGTTVLAQSASCTVLTSNGLDG